MHMVEIGKLEEGVAFEQLDAAACVRRRVMQQSRPYRVGPARRPALACAVAAVHPPACEQPRVVPGRIPRREQSGDVGRIVLAVAVQGHDPLRPGCFHAIADGRALAALHRMLQHAQLAHLLLQRLQDLRAVVGGMVVDVDDFELRATVQVGHDLAHQARDVVAFVEHRNDDRKLRQRPGGSGESIGHGDFRRMDFRIRMMGTQHGDTWVRRVAAKAWRARCRKHVETVLRACESFSTC